jgi:hypothetical protein
MDTNGTLTAHYEYDANGNRVADVNNDAFLTFNQPSGVLLDAAYDNQDRLLNAQHAALSTAYTYTANEELRQDGRPGTVTTYRPNNLLLRRWETSAASRCRAATRSSTSSTAKPARQQDAGARRLYDGQLRIVAELDGTGALVSRFVYGAKANVPST